MKRVDLLQERHPTSQPCRQKLPLRFLVGPGDQMSRVGFFIEAVAGLYLEIDQPVQLVLSQADEIADHVGDEILVCPGALKIERQQREIFGRRTEGFRSQKTRHGVPAGIYSASFWVAARDPKASARMTFRTPPVFSATRVRTFSSVTRFRNRSFRSSVLNAAPFCGLAVGARRQT